MKRELAAGLIIKDSRILLLKNIKPGRMRVEPPGGKVRPGESCVEAVKREVREEPGVEAGNFRSFAVHMTTSPKGELCISATSPGWPQCMELEKFSGFGWYAFFEVERLMEEGSLVENMAAALPGLKRFFIGPG